METTIVWLCTRNGLKMCRRRQSQGTARGSAWLGNPVQYPEHIGLVLGTGERKINMISFLKQMFLKVSYCVINAPLWIWIKH